MESEYTECSFCRIIRRPDSFSERVIGRHCGLPRQTEGQLFGDHLISQSVSVAPSSLTESSFYNVLFCVFIARVRYNLEQRVFVYDCYEKTNSYKSKLVMKVRFHGILTDRNPLIRNRVFTEKKLDDIGH
jgi:hypothetical protein